MEGIILNTDEVQILENLDLYTPKMAQKTKLIEGGVGDDEIICAIRGETAKRLVAALDMWPIHWPQQQT
jgi:hypothetical protein